MVESGRVLGKGRIRASIGKLSRRVQKNGRINVIPKNDRIRASTGKMQNPYEYRKTVRVSTEKESNQCEYRKMIESGRVQEKGRIRTSIEKLSW